VYSTLCILCQRWVFSEQTIIRIVAWRTFSFLRLPLPFLLSGTPRSLGTGAFLVVFR
jgi:hypothetical protein